MIDRVRLLWKSLTGEINTRKALYKLIYTAIGYISSFFSFAVLLKELTICDRLEEFTKDCWPIIVIAGLLASCVSNRKKINYYKTVSDCGMQIAISVKDIFSNRTANSYVIPTNTFFRTKMEDEYISPQSVQGRFQLKYFKNDIDHLDKMISASLVKQGIDGEDAHDCFGLTKKYPIGTVAKINYKKKHFYFVAVNDVNRYGKPIGQNLENVTKALDSVIKAIRKIGHCDTLCVPLIGSGRAAIREATKEIVSQKTIDCFVESEDKVVSKLIISIRPKDYLNGEIDLDRVKRYLDYRCEFC